MSGQKFSLPIDFDLNYLACHDEKVCVVSIIGKTAHNSHFCKAGLVNPIIDADVFTSSIPGESDGKDEGKTTEADLCKIEGYYDSENHVIYLHLKSVYDTTALSHLCERSAECIKQQGYGEFLQDAEHTHARALLFLFSVSHIVLLINPGSSFDISYVRLFRVLDMIRLKLQSSLTETLRGLSLGKDWVLSGRPCSPRVLFVFLSSTLDGVTEPEFPSKSRSQKPPPAKRLQHAIEDQIYRILRKARIITNISNNSLFAIPANQEFVFVHQRPLEEADPVMFYLQQLRNNCAHVRESDVPRTRGYQSNRHSSYSSGGSRRRVPSVTSHPEEASFRDFLWQHIELALTKGFDDNVGRNPVSAIFEVPTAETWFLLADKLYKYFMIEFLDHRGRPHFNTLKSLLDINVRFSEGRCSKVLPLAESAYREGLPQHYTKSCHQTQLSQARRVFLQHARGPACDKYLQQLEETCLNVWLNGRQLCEEMSLTGNHCVNELHRVPGEAETEENKSLPVKSHISAFKLKSACNCGGRQGDKDDPFYYKTSNYDFYEMMTELCCADFGRYEFPTFVSTTEEAKAASRAQRDDVTHVKDDVTSLKDDVRVDSPKPITRKESVRVFDVTQGMSNLSLALSLGQSGGDDILGQAPQALTPNNDVTSGTDVTNPPDPEDPEEEEEDVVSMETVAPVSRQHSTTEYLAGMVHSEAPTGLLPRFSSWSLLSMGPYSTYIPAQGLELPGFLHNIGYLLPWEISVPVAKEKWPTVGETSGKKIKPRKTQKDAAGDLVVKLYVGFDYECPRGHRFFLNSPDKIFKAPSSGHFKDTGHKVMNNDMPIYFPCQCKTSATKGYMSQLMRFFIAIPDAGVQVTLNPKVIPSPGPCPTFYPSVDGAVTLSHGLWVLRLPHIYMGEGGVFPIPTDHQEAAACRILKGVAIVTEATKT